MQLSGWGRYPVIESLPISPFTASLAQKTIASAEYSQLIPRGLGRSYGDSSLGAQVLQTTYLNHILAFDSSQGLVPSWLVLKCDPRHEIRQYRRRNSQ